MASVGPDRLAELMPVIREISRAFYTSDARFSARDVSEMYLSIVEEFRTKYPLLPRTAVEAPAWCYTFDYK
jgi:hypothetical protein